MTCSKNKKNGDSMNKKINDGRNFMKSDFGVPASKSDQKKGIKQPALQKQFKAESNLVALPAIDDIAFDEVDFIELIHKRRSLRKFSDKSLTKKELAFLLWSTQGVKKIIKNGYASYRTVPSAGARHPYETYLIINRVENLKKGVYRYIPLEHKLLFCFSSDDIKHKLDEATFGQSFVAKSAVVFLWSAIPYRAEWRYSTTSHKPMLLDAGHICQNLYLSCELIDCGTCAIAAYNQDKIDDLLKLDGEEEFIVYLAPVGKK